MFAQLKNRRLYLMVFIETIIFAISYTSAYLIRFEFALTPQNLDQIILILPWLIPLKIVVFFTFGLYKGMWRYASLHDFWRLAEGCCFSTLLVVAIIYSLYGLGGFSRAVFFLDAVLTFLLTGGVRIGIRTCYEFRDSSANKRGWPHLLTGKPRNPKRILIIGAGRTGEKILREVLDNPDLNYEVVGFLDDDPRKKERSIHRAPILGAVDLLPQIAGRQQIDQVFISVPSATGPEMRRILHICKQSRIPFKTLPGIGQIMDGKVSISSLRDINYEDLLRRPPVNLDSTAIRDYLVGKKILVTGAGGSIGSELCRQLIRFHPEKLILVDSSEANLYAIQMELRHQLHFDACPSILSRVQHEAIMNEVFETHLPEVVFHAAAYKHVPLIERNPWEAIYNNVIGSRVVMEMAVKYGVKRFVLVSSDKAVRPTNVMGATKRAAELIMQSRHVGNTRFMAVRFGNVLASSGSVVPLFLKQIERGGPVTVTHPDMTRYFMTIPEASQLILQAGSLGEGGEIFVLEMGTPVKIADMAADLIRLSGKEPGKDIEIVFTGPRPGEKIHEELITAGEDVKCTKYDKIMVLHHNGRWNWYGHKNRDVYRNLLNTQLEELRTSARTLKACCIKEKLSEIVPEYTPRETECVLDPIIMKTG